MSTVEMLVRKIREHATPLGELQSLLNQLVEVARPTLVTPDTMTALREAAEHVREQKAAVQTARRAVETIDRELDGLIDRSAPSNQIEKGQTKLEAQRRQLDLAERNCRAAIRKQSAAAESTREALDERHDQLCETCNGLSHEFGHDQREGSFRHLLDKIVEACGVVSRTAVIYNLHTHLSETINDAIRAASEPPLPESEISERRAVSV